MILLDHWKFRILNASSKFCISSLNLKYCQWWQHNNGPVRSFRNRDENRGYQWYNSCPWWWHAIYNTQKFLTLRGKLDKGQIGKLTKRLIFLIHIFQFSSIVPKILIFFPLSVHLALGFKWSFRRTKWRACWPCGWQSSASCRNSIWWRDIYQWCWRRITRVKAQRNFGDPIVYRFQHAVHSEICSWSGMHSFLLKMLIQAQCLLFKVFCWLFERFLFFQQIFSQWA